MTVDFGHLEQSIQYNIRDILDGRVCGRRICHVWYDDETQAKTMYHGKVEKLKKGRGTYVVSYWNEEEGKTYNEAVEYDISKYALAANLACEDLIMS